MSKFDPLHVQCAVKQQYQPIFTGTNQPRLLYVSNIRPQTSMYPRMLHAHADAVELALMYSGSGKFFIHDRYVPVSAGDLLIYNSGVIHDEISSADNPIGMYCITFSGLHMPGLRPNALLADDRNCVIPCGEHFESMRFLFELMFKQLSSDYPNASVFCHNMMEALLVQALTLAADAPQNQLARASVWSSRWTSSSIWTPTTRSRSRSPTSASICTSATIICVTCSRISWAMRR